ncbi:MAG: type I 3-dehydroquinate dehydratase [Firmicutes bacterium]|jgi:3-dehydroquinate dehydratase-1|nr:type I 3-dehydroquinate dehydratase [Bacillota bacterium]MDH7496792.1 type I 3-dehydroquinate dehydratase [Bacillota bacterium]
MRAHGRPLARFPVKAGDVVIGGFEPVVCVPVVARTAEEAVKIASDAASSGADMIEMRADHVDGLNSENVRDMLAAVAKSSSLPIIFTNRLWAEGGARQVPEEERVEIQLAAMECGGVAVVDIELATEPRFRSRVLEVASRRGVSVILSYHNFRTTPSKREILGIVKEEVKAGGNIVKFAVTPRHPRDVLVALDATWEAKEMTGLPVISMSMGEMGKYSRVVGPLYGCDLTFASLGRASAPGQIDVREIRYLLNSLT